MARRKIADLPIPASENRKDLQCSYVSDGIKCRYPGTISHANDGSGRWYCSLHFDAPLGSQYAAQVVEASQAYVHPSREDREREHDRMIKAWLRDNETGGTREECMVMMRALPGRMRGGHISTEWAQHVLARRDAGETMPGIAIEKAELALGIAKHQYQPGDENGT